jgi:superfamily II DNA helicase RecQ
MQVQDDIMESVLRNPLRLVSSFNRPNISYEVFYQLQGSASPVSRIADIIDEMSQASRQTSCCIIYTLKRETADEVARKLSAKGTFLAH